MDQICSVAATSDVYGPPALSTANENDVDIGRTIETLLEKVRNIQVTQDEILYRETSAIVQDDRCHLRPSEMICLMVAFVRGRAGLATGYAEVIDFSFKYMPKPLADGTVCKAFQSLFEIGCLTKADVKPSRRPGRQRELYVITDLGVVALKLAVAFARHLHDCRIAMAS